MKRILLTLIAAVIVTASTAQTKSKPKLPTPAPVAASIKKDSTVYTLTDKQVNDRVTATLNLLFIIKSGTDNLTPNQLRGAVKLADSLVKIDSDWYIKIHPVKKQ